MRSSRLFWKSALIAGAALRKFVTWTRAISCDSVPAGSLSGTSAASNPHRGRLLGLGLSSHWTSNDLPHDQLDRYRLQRELQLKWRALPHQHLPQTERARRSAWCSESGAEARCGSVHTRDFLICLIIATSLPSTWHSFTPSCHVHPLMGKRKGGRALSALHATSCWLTGCDKPACRADETVKL